MSKIHVLHVVPTLGGGGMEMAMSRIVNGLHKEGISHSIVVLKGEAIIREQFDPAVKIHCLHAQPRDAGLLLQLRRLIRTERPSVIHARNLSAWPEVALARLSLLPQVPLVFSFHGLAGTAPLSLRWQLTCRLLARITNSVFTVSQGAKDFLIDQAALSADKVAVIPNGVDTTRFFPSPIATSHGEFRIGTLGNLTPVKNQALLVRACHRLAEQGVALRLEIAGEGRERAALEALILELGMTDRVSLIGHVADTPAFLRSLDAFVLPSYSEAHPNALSEAMACGLPCIGSRVGGMPEILDQGRAGLLFESDDENALSKSLKSLIDDPALRQKLGRAALERTCEKYSMDVMLDNYRNLYRRLSGLAPDSKSCEPSSRDRI